MWIIKVHNVRKDIWVFFTECTRDHNKYSVCVVLVWSEAATPAQQQKTYIGPAVKNLFFPSWVSPPHTHTMMHLKSLSYNTHLRAACVSVVSMGNTFSVLLNHTLRAESPPPPNPLFESVRPQHICLDLWGAFCFASCFWMHVCAISTFCSVPGVKSLLLSQSQGSPYSMSGQRNVRALWANCKGEGRQNQVCVSQPVWYIQRKEPWNTKACWWVSRSCPSCYCHVILSSF